MSLQLLACEAGDADCVALLRHWDADQAEELLLSCFSEGPNAGHTPLSIAAKRGHYTVVHELLTEPPVTSPDSGPYEGAALFEAAAGGHTDIVRLLLERGARLECLGAPLALRAALAKRHWAVCAVLVAHGAPVQEITDSSSLLEVMAHATALQLNRVLPELLLRAKELQAVVDIPIEHGGTLLTNAILCNNTAALEAYLDAGASVHACDAQGRSALVLAILLGLSNVVRILLRHGADPNTATSPDGPTPLQLAVQLWSADRMHMEATHGLESAEAEPTSEPAASGSFLDCGQESSEAMTLIFPGPAGEQRQTALEREPDSENTGALASPKSRPLPEEEVCADDLTEVSSTHATSLSATGGAADCQAQPSNAAEKATLCPASSASPQLPVFMWPSATGTTVLQTTSPRPESQRSTVVPGGSGSGDYACRSNKSICSHKSSDATGKIGCGVAPARHIFRRQAAPSVFAADEGPSSALPTPRGTGKAVSMSSLLPSELLDSASSSDSHLEGATQVGSVPLLLRISNVTSDGVPLCERSVDTCKTRGGKALAVERVQGALGKVAGWGQRWQRLRRSLSDRGKGEPLVDEGGPGTADVGWQRLRRLLSDQGKGEPLVDEGGPGTADVGWQRWLSWCFAPVSGSSRKGSCFGVCFGKGHARRSSKGLSIPGPVMASAPTAIASEHLQPRALCKANSLGKGQDIRGADHLRPSYGSGPNDQRISSFYNHMYSPKAHSSCLAPISGPAKVSRRSQERTPRSLKRTGSWRKSLLSSLRLTPSHCRSSFGSENICAPLLVAAAPMDESCHNGSTTLPPSAPSGRGSEDAPRRFSQDAPLRLSTDGPIRLSGDGPLRVVNRRLVASQQNCSSLDRCLHPRPMHGAAVASRQRPLSPDACLHARPMHGWAVPSRQRPSSSDACLHARPVHGEVNDSPEPLQVASLAASLDAQCKPILLPPPHSSEEFSGALAEPIVATVNSSSKATNTPTLSQGRLPRAAPEGPWLQPSGSPLMWAASEDSAPEEQLMVTISQAVSAESEPQPELVAAASAAACTAAQSSAVRKRGSRVLRLLRGKRLKSNPVHHAGVEPDSGTIADDEADDASTALLMGGDSLMTSEAWALPRNIPELPQSESVEGIPHKRFSGSMTGASPRTDHCMPRADVSGSISVPMAGLLQDGGSTADLSSLMHAYSPNSRDGDAVASELPGLEAADDEMPSVTSPCSEASSMSETLLAPGVLSSDILSNRLANTKSIGSTAPSGTQTGELDLPSLGPIGGSSHELQNLASSSGVTSMLMSDRSELTAKCSARGQQKGVLKRVTQTSGYGPAPPGVSKPRVRFRVDGDIGVMTCVRLLFEATDDARGLVGERLCTLLEKHDVL